MLICMDFAIKCWWPENSDMGEKGGAGSSELQKYLGLYISLHTSPFPYVFQHVGSRREHRKVGVVRWVAKSKAPPYPPPNFSPFWNLFCRTKQGQGFQGLWKMPCQWGGLYNVDLLLFFLIFGKNRWRQSHWSRISLQPIYAGCYLFLYVSLEGALRPCHWFHSTVEARQFHGFISILHLLLKYLSMSFALFSIIFKLFV